jgi:hypothetical protein
VVSSQVQLGEATPASPGQVRQYAQCVVSSQVQLGEAIPASPGQVREYAHCVVSSQVQLGEATPASPGQVRHMPIAWSAVRCSSARLLQFHLDIFAKYDFANLHSFVV